jgi:MFS family permease
LSGLRSLPKTVWVLGGVSLLMDSSSELVHALLPVFMVSTLKAGTASVGLIEGLSEATALVVKAWSGTLCDRWGSRKSLALAGYGLSALAKPLFPLAQGLEGVFFARFADRIGKGVRGAPRDALIAEVTPPGSLGEAYGLRQSLDTLGGILGPVLGLLLFSALDGDVRAVLWVATIPAALAVGLLAAGVSEPPGAPPPSAPLELSAWRRFSRGYWLLAAAGAVFSLGRFSEAFLILRARSNGLPDALAPLVPAVMAVVYAVTAHPAGRLADQIPRRRLLMAGVAALVAADACLALARGLLLTTVGTMLWGLHLGLTQGVFSALVAGYAPPGLRGTAFGVFHLLSGAGLLAGNALAGLVWDAFGPQAAFWTGAAFAVCSLAFLPRGR